MFPGAERADVQVGRDTLTHGLDSQLDLQAQSGCSPPRHLQADGESQVITHCILFFSYSQPATVPPRHMSPARATQWKTQDGGPRSQRKCLDTGKGHTQKGPWTLTYPSGVWPSSFLGGKGQLAHSGKSKIRVPRQGTESSWHPA